MKLHFIYCKTACVCTGAELQNGRIYFHCRVITHCGCQSAIIMIALCLNPTSSYKDNVSLYLVACLVLFTILLRS